MSVTVGDINNDGHLDVTAGAFCYMGPEFNQYPLRRLLPFRDDYMENNGEHLVDVNKDGWLDVVSGSFMQPELFWYENPGTTTPKDYWWNVHRLVNTEQTHNENTRLHDLDGDGIINTLDPDIWDPINLSDIVNIEWGPWDTNSLAAGEYSATIYSTAPNGTDLCATEFNFSISTPSELYVFVPDYETCINCPINVSAEISGGQGPYFDIWTNLERELRLMRVFF